MQLIAALIDFILHIDVHLGRIIADYHMWTYAILFLIVFAETGLVVTPLLPGDSLLFAAGAFAAKGSLSVWIVYVVLFAACVLGDNSNYWIGRYLGPKVCRPDSRILKKEYLDKTNNFFHKYGAKTIVIARFVPIVRTFAPFMAGVGAMRYTVFLAYSLGGGALWIGGFVTAGYLFGGLPIVEKYFTLAILAIIAVSLLPAVYHFAQHKLQARRRAAVQADERS